jgi:hypothetical protein
MFLKFLPAFSEHRAIKYSNNEECHPRVPVCWRAYRKYIQPVVEILGKHQEAPLHRTNEIYRGCVLRKARKEADRDIQENFVRFEIDAT